LLGGESLVNRQQPSIDVVWVTVLAEPIDDLPLVGYGERWLERVWEDQVQERVTLLGGTLSGERLRELFEDPGIRQTIVPGVGELFRPCSREPHQEAQLCVALGLISHTCTGDFLMESV
jgi:hypothetical protein